MVNGLNESGKLPVKVVYKGTANSSKEVEAVFKAANNDDKCVGVITWMHTFSPAKMWIHGLQQLKKPLLHLHTQFNKEIPWDTMDMDFMNLNQSAHGDREFGHICTRMRIRRKVVVGYWKEEETLHKIAVWMRVCAGWADSQDMLIIRFGDQMNNVAVTDGDKVEAEQRMGYHVDYCPASELMEYHKDIKNADVDALVATYFNDYDHDASLEDKSTEAYQKVWNAAKAELALRAILKAKGAKGFTTNFDDLGQTDGSYFDQIPGLASQRLMAEGYGFGAEGDWKSAALYRTVWVMNQGLPKGCSFLEDYTFACSLRINVTKSGKEISKTDQTYKYIIDIPKKYQNLGTSYRLIGIGAGQVYIFDDMDSNPATLTYETDMPTMTFGLVYK